MHATLSITQFAHASRDFCDWVEKSADQVTSEKEPSLKARQHIAKVYLLALSLPVDWSDEWASIESAERVSAQHRADLMPRLQALPFGFYNVFFTPSNLEDKHVMGDLADDILDIYCDLKEGLALHDRGHEGLAAWTWRFSFHSHWAKHAADALHALQAHASQAA